MTTPDPSISPWLTAFSLLFSNNRQCFAPSSQSQPQRFMTSPTTPQEQEQEIRSLMNTSTTNNNEEETKELSIEEKDQEEKDHAKCLKWRDNLLKNSPIIKFMMEHLAKSGCALQPEHFKCVPCDKTRAGGFSPDFGILLCQNRFLSKSHMEDTISHELIHAYDHCTVNIDWGNCDHYACSEIRAASLSGDCKWTRELRRGHLGIAKQHQACVKRRATLAVRQIPFCQGKNANGEEIAEEAVNRVFESCFKDTAPFDEIY